MKFRNEELGEYFEGSDLQEVTECAICGSLRSEVWAPLGKTEILKCFDCGFGWVNRFPSVPQIAKYYDDYIGRRRLCDTISFEKREEQYRVDADFIKSFIAEGSVLDVGCSGGYFLGHFIGFERFGVEIDAAALDEARKNLPDATFRVWNQGEIPFDDRKFDLVTLRGVIEHLPNVKDTVERICAAIKPGGYLFLCATPNFASKVADLFRQDWRLVHPIQHLQYFDENSLVNLMAEFNLKKVAVEYPYIGSPYENFSSDLSLMTAKQNGDLEPDTVSPPFYEAMISIVFRNSC